MTRRHQMIYYAWLDYYNQTAPVTTVHSTETLIPARWTGLLVVLGLVGLHFALTAVTMALFAQRTRVSALGQTWQAIAQMVSPRAREVIEMADASTDGRVKEWAEATGRDAGMYYMAWSDESGRVEIQLRDKGPRRGFRDLQDQQHTSPDRVFSGLPPGAMQSWSLWISPSLTHIQSPSASGGHLAFGSIRGLASAIFLLRLPPLSA